MSLGNTQLVDYGIQNDESDVRMHVGVLAQKVYVFKTQDGKDSIKSHHRIVPVFTKGIKTATGYVVPVGEMINCDAIDIPQDIYMASQITRYPEKGAQGEKGKAAVYIAVEMLKRGLIPISLKITEVNEKTMQIKGEDVNVKANVKIQVKCDYRAGNGHHRCTENLFLQISECNPFKIY